MLSRSSGRYHTSYRTELRRVRTPGAWLALLALALVLLWAVPAWLPPAFVGGVLTQVFIYMIAAVGLNILVGYTGQISLGQAAFMGIGGFAASLLITGYPQLFAFQPTWPNLVGWARGELAWLQNVLFLLDLRFWPVLLLVVVAASLTALVGLLFGVPSLRVEGLYLLIATLAAQEIIAWLLPRTKFLTGGRSLQIRPGLILEAGGSAQYDRRWYFILLVWAVLAVVLAANLMRGRLGRALVAIRDRDVAAEVMGVNLFGYKLRAFGLAAFYAGAAGALWTLYYKGGTFQFTLAASLQLLAMIIIGGLGSTLGSVLGPLVIVLLPWSLRELVYPAVGAASPWLGDALAPRASLVETVVFSSLVILFLLFEGQGLARLWRNVRRYFALWPFRFEGP